MGMQSGLVERMQSETINLSSVAGVSWSFQPENGRLAVHRRAGGRLAGIRAQEVSP